MFKKKGKSMTDEQQNKERDKELRAAYGGGAISSNMAKRNRAGDMVEAKRLGLLHAQGEPQVGRRETPKVDPWPKRMMYIKGILAGLIVVVAVVAVIMVLASGSTLA